MGTRVSRSPQGADWGSRLGPLEPVPRVSQGLHSRNLQRAPRATGIGLMLGQVISGEVMCSLHCLYSTGRVSLSKLVYLGLGKEWWGSASLSYLPCLMHLFLFSVLRPGVLISHMESLAIMKVFSCIESCFMHKKIPILLTLLKMSQSNSKIN